MTIINVLIYSIFITLSFLLSVVSPILIGVSIAHSINSKNYVSKAIRFLFRASRRLNIIFIHIYIKTCAACDFLVKHLEFYILVSIKYIKIFIVFLSKKVNSPIDLDIPETVENMYLFENKHFQKLLDIIKVISSIGILTLLYYLVTLINLSDVCLEVTDTILNIFGKDLSVKSFLVLMVKNIPLVFTLTNMSFWFIRIIIQVIISVIYVSILLHGLLGVREVTKELFAPKIGSKFKGITSFSFQNISLLICLTFISLLAFSVAGEVDILASILLILNVFNIQLSLGVATVTIGPMVAEKICMNIINSKIQSAPLTPMDIFN